MVCTIRACPHPLLCTHLDLAVRASSALCIQGKAVLAAHDGRNSLHIIATLIADLLLNTAQAETHTAVSCQLTCTPSKCTNTVQLLAQSIRYRVKQSVWHSVSKGSSLTLCSTALGSVLRTQHQLCAQPSSLPCQRGSAGLGCHLSRPEAERSRHGVSLQGVWSMPNNGPGQRDSTWCSQCNQPCPCFTQISGANSPLPCHSSL